MNHGVEVSECTSAKSVSGIMGLTSSVALIQYQGAGTTPEIGEFYHPILKL